MTSKRIKEYDEKRRFDKTPEPPGVVQSEKKHELRFVIHKHDATRLHYDLRLESKGVMPSWAVPRGPSMNPEDKRLAVHVEDHPLDYRNFEGVIPKGEYGGGPVMIWDEGTYEPAGVDEGKGNIEGGLKKGHVAFIAHGKKIEGEFDLIQTHGDQSDGGKNWLLVKREDEFAGNSNFKDDESVRSGRTMADIISNKPAEDISGLLDLAKRTSIPESIDPMLSTLLEKPFDNNDFIFEIKWDGYRTIAIIKRGEVDLFSRNHKSFNQKFEIIKKALSNITFNAVLDGEVVALDSNGRADFGSLQNWEENKRGTLVYVIFDILYYDHFDLRDLPLHARKKILSRVLPNNPLFTISDYIEERGKDFFKAAEETGIEGIVAKKINSSYQEGARGRDWLKIKSIKTDEAVICGYTEGRASRKHFGALVLGQYRAGKLTYIGHTGGGFDDEKLKSIKQKLEPLKIKKTPFEVEPKTNAPVTWVKPQIVCEVKFSEWTSEGIMRQPVFVGIREDKNPKDVAREEVKKPDEVLSDPKVEFSNLEKIYWPRHKYTKGDMIKYYEEVSDLMLPYIKNRPHSLLRHPNGAETHGFYQKNVEDVAPDWIKTFKDYLESEERYVTYLVATDKASLLYMANLGCIEINPWLSRIDSPKNPDFMVLDLDPEDIGFDKVIETALEIRELTEKFEIATFPKTSGKTGIHIMVPLGAKYSYDESKQFGQLLAYIVNSKIPEFTSVERSPSKRQKKVYIDYLQNRYSQTITAPYSLRPTPDATVSTPLEWSEVNKKLDMWDFTIKTIRKRLDKVGDLYKGILDEGIDMKKAIERISALNMQINK